MLTSLPQQRPVPAATELEEIARLNAALNERVLANDKEGAIQIYSELMRAGRSLQEIEDLTGNVSPIPVGRGSAEPSPGPDYTAPAAPAKLHRSLIAGLSRGGLAAGAIVAAASIGVLLMHATAEKLVPGDPAASEVGLNTRVEISSAAAATVELPAAPQVERASTALGTSTTKADPSAAALVVLPLAQPAPQALPIPEAREPEMVSSVAAPTPAAETEPSKPVSVALPTPAPPTPDVPVAAATPATPPDRPPPDASEISALLARGDSLLAAGDIVSARLFYERASDAGDGRAALRLGATYDPDFLDRVHLPRLQADVARALSWYHRARDLGESDAELWIKALRTKPEG